jgi:hypothetical protein
MLLIFFTEVHPFGSVTAEPISVDIVAPKEVTAKPSEPQLPRKEEETRQIPPEAPPQPVPSSKEDSSAKAATASSPPPAAPPPAAKSAPAAAPPLQKQAALAQPSSAPPPSRPAPTAAPALDQKGAAPLPAQPAYHPAQPDLSVKYPDLSAKYHMWVGLPQDRPGDGFDAPATEKADVAEGLISEFRRHLKTCSTLPKEIAPADKVAIKLRVLMTPDGRLAAEPVLIEASASMKGPLLLQSAISALRACQPYAMLPPDHYQEWKVLDLNFTPQDFINAS